MASQHEYQVGSQRVVLLERSIVELELVDALVSSDDNHLSHGGGVSRALWQAAGHELRQNCSSLPELRLGEVFTTPAYGLKARWLLHAITIDFERNRRLGPHEARQLFGTVLDRAAELGCESIALPLLGAGAGRLTPAACAIAAAEAFDERAAVPSSVRKVIVTALGTQFRIVVDVFAERIVQRPAVEELLPEAAEAAGDMGSTLVEAWRRCHEIDSEPAALIPLFEVALRALVARGLVLALRAREPAASPRTERLGVLLSTATDLFRAAGEPLTSELQFACGAAIEARNRLAHASAESSADRGQLQRTILHAVEQIIGFLARSQRPPQRASYSLAGAASVATPMDLAVPAWKTFSARRTSRPATVSEPPARPASSSPISAPPPREGASQPTGTTHVPKLRDCLLLRLPPQALAALLDDLTNEGYRGRDEDRLLEKCVRVEDPVGFLCDEFTARDLARELERETGIKPRNSASGRELAAELLESFGFPALRAPRGLATVRRQIAKLSGTMIAGSSLQLRGAVTEASAHLEYVVQVLLRFVCQAAFRQSPEALFQAQERLEPSYTLDRCSLGKLLDLLEHLAQQIEGGDGMVAELRRDLGTRRLVPRGISSVVEARNRFAHAEKAQTELPLAEARRLARTFFDGALAMLDYFDDPQGRVFPHIIRIEHVGIDRWGRRTIEAISDADVGEHLFTDENLRPGQLYFMHPLTNPLRVDPILVPAGEIGMP